MSPRLEYAGGAEALTLAGTLSAGTTASTTSSETPSANWPAGAVGKFMIQINSEIILVTSRSGVTFTTLARAQCGTAAATHNAGDAIRAVWETDSATDFARHVYAGDDDHTIYAKKASNLSDLTNAATARTNLALVPGTNVQAYDEDLAAIAALSPSNDDVLQRKAGGWTNRTLAQLLTDLGLGSGFEEWTGYTPTVTQGVEVTKAVTYGKFSQIGKTVACEVLLALTSAGTAGQDVTITLPVTAAQAGSIAVGTGWWNALSTPLWFFLPSTTTTAPFTTANASGPINRGSSGGAGTCASGQSISFSIIYQAA